MERVKLAQGAEGVPLALMLSEIVNGNLERPEKLKTFNTMALKACLMAKDVGAVVTLSFDRGTLTFYGGNLDGPDLSIETDSATLLDLANINISFGMPYYFDGLGRSILKKLGRRELRIKGILRHPVALTKLTKVISIN